MAGDLDRAVQADVGDHDLLVDALATTELSLHRTPIPMPPAVEHLIRGYQAHRARHLPATDPDNPWLFPGRHPGQPLQPNAVRDRLRALGIPNSKGRARALRELLLHAPPAVIAPLLGYKAEAAEQIAAETGNTWKNYATGTRR